MEELQIYDMGTGKKVASVYRKSAPASVGNYHALIGSKQYDILCILAEDGPSTTSEIRRALEQMLEQYEEYEGIQPYSAANAIETLRRCWARGWTDCETCPDFLVRWSLTDRGQRVVDEL